MRNIAQIPHGLIEYTVNVVLEGRRPEQYQYSAWIDLVSRDMRRILQFIEEQHVPSCGENLDLFSLTLICALDFIDFRLADFNWKKDCPKLSSWHDNISQNPHVKETYPTL